jgi:tRNA (guanine37-N1)-methyltransferase
MKITVLSLFPEILESYFQTSIMAKAIEKQKIEYDLINIRDFAFDKHNTCDDAPYGGGAGMLLKAEPLALALDSVSAKQKTCIYPSPSGQLFTQERAKGLVDQKELVIICGRYEGIDQRIIDTYVDYEYCIGDYVLSSGEIAALVLVDTVYRLKDGVINPESLKEESHEDGLLEYPQYTRPEEILNLRVPDVLLSGHHKNIAQWRRTEQINKTLKNRPELLEQADLTANEKQELHKLKNQGGQYGLD